jgi:hypothetical protein
MIKERVPTMIEYELNKIFKSIPSNAEYHTQLYWRMYGPYPIMEMINNGTIMPNANRI